MINKKSFFNSILRIKELSDIDLAYDMLCIGHMTNPTFKHNQFHVIVVTIAKSFVLEFQCLPSSLIKYFILEI